MSYAEAVRLTQVLSTDPSSHIAAAVHGWDAPVSREWLVLADTFDRLTHLHTDRKAKPEPYPRPFPDPARVRRGKTTRTRGDVLAILNAHGHNLGGDSA